MSKKIILLSIFLIFLGAFLLSFNLTYAEVIFNEIAWKGMPTGATHEWLELINTGTDPEDISGWTIKDETGQLNITIPDATSIPAGGFYVIKRTTSTVTPFDLSVSFNGGLADTGEKLILSDKNSTQINIADFLSGWPDTAMTSVNTMQWNSSSWITAAPTPGAANTTPPVEDDNTEEEDSTGGGSGSSSESSSSSSSSSSGSSSSSKKSAKSQESKMTAVITVPKIVFVGIPFEFMGKAVDKQGIKPSEGRYFWNFGDGNSKQSRKAKDFPYTYEYEGDYVVSLEYYSKTYSKTPDAAAELVLKVVPLNVSISKVGSESDFFIELTNNTNYEIDISSWTLSSSNKKFVFPRNSSILGKKKLVLSSKLTNFDFSDQESLKLSNEKEQLVFDYGSTSSKPKVAAAPVIPNPVNLPVTAISKPKPQVPATTQISSVVQPEIPLPETPTVAAADLSASALSALPDTESGDNSTITFIAWVVFLVIGAGAVYFIRLRKAPLSSGEDFDILDE